MFCSNCGAPNPDNSKFCEACGKPLAAEAPAANTTAPAPQPASAYSPQPQNVYQPVAPIIKPPVIRSTHPVLNAVKSIVASPTYIVATVAYSLFVLFSLISSFSGTSDIFSLLQKFTGIFDELAEYSYSVLNTAEGLLNAYAIIGMLPNIIIATGLWLTFAFATRKGDNGLGTSGLTMIKVISVINMIGYIIAVALIEILLIVLLVKNAEAAKAYSGFGLTSSASSVSGGLIVFFMLLVGGIYAFLITLQAKTVSTINTVKTTVLTGIASDKVSSFVGVICYINAGFQVISVFLALNAAGVFSSLFTATALICFGLLIFNYKRKMLLLNPSAVNPNYNQNMA